MKAIRTMLRKAIWAGLVAHAFAQERRTTSAPAAATATTPTKAPTVSLFLPMGHPDRVEASIISAVSFLGVQSCGRELSLTSDRDIRRT